ncbi:MRN complex-interacting protein isoform 1-T2 [Menidia menidia]
MGQEFHVVRCFSCQSFQVQQVKKTSRWSCKLCGQKQSLLKEFGRGPAVDCRRHVQKLNAMRGSMMDQQDHGLLRETLDQEEEEEEEGGSPQTHQGGNQVGGSQVSRWSKYLSREEAEPQAEGGVVEGGHLESSWSDISRPRPPVAFESGEEPDFEDFGDFEDFVRPDQRV